MERPERPSRPEKPNRNHMRIRRRISSLLYGIGTHDSTDSETEDINALQSGRRPVSRRHSEFRSSYAGGDNHDSFRHSPPSPLPLSPPSRNYLDVPRRDQSNQVYHTMQPFRSPQRPLPISVNHTYPMYNQASSSSTYDPVSSRSREFNILLHQTVGNLRDIAGVDRERNSSMFNVCDSAVCDGTGPTAKRFCTNTTGHVSFSSSPRQQTSFSNSTRFPIWRERSDPIPCTSSAASALAEDLSMSISPRDTDRRLSNNDELTNFSAQSSERNSTSFAGPSNASVESHTNAVNGEGSARTGILVPVRSPNPFTINESCSHWTNPSRESNRAPTNRMALVKNLSRTSNILRVVNELEEAHLRNRDVDDLDDEVLPSSPAGDSDDREGVDEDVRTAAASLEFLRDSAEGDMLSQAIDREVASQEQQEQDHSNQPQIVGINYDEPISDEEVVFISNIALTDLPENALRRESAEMSDDDDDDDDSGSTDQAEEMLSRLQEIAEVTSHHVDDEPAGPSDDGPTTEGVIAPPVAQQPESLKLDGQEFNAKLVSLLECPVCLEVIVPPIRQCKKGHPVCNVCRPRLHECPTCRSRFTESRNLLMEKVAEFMFFPCKNSLMGCSVSIPLKEKIAHEIGCGFRQYSCIDRNCDWKGFKQELLVHCNSLHPDKVILSTSNMYRSMVIPFELDRQTSWVMSAIDEVFLVTFKAFQHNILRGCTVYLGPPDNATKFNYYFKFGGTKRKCFKYREMTTPNKMSIHCSDFFQDACFSYQFDASAFKMQNGKPVIEGKVAVTKVNCNKCGSNK